MRYLKTPLRPAAAVAALAATATAGAAGATAASGHGPAASPPPCSLKPPPGGQTKPTTVTTIGQAYSCILAHYYAAPTLDDRALLGEDLPVPRAQFPACTIWPEPGVPHVPYRAPRPTRIARESPAWPAH
jgi:hypothetical protein